MQRSGSRLQSLAVSIASRFASVRGGGSDHQSTAANSRAVTCV